MKRLASRLMVALLTFAVGLASASLRPRPRGSDERSLPPRPPAKSMTAATRCEVGEAGRLSDAASLDAVGDRPVDLIVGLFAPPKAGAEHLRALAAVSRALRSPELREQLRQARTTDAIRALFVKDATAATAA